MMFGWSRRDLTQYGESALQCATPCIETQSINRRPIVINTVKIPARAGGGGAPRSARGSVTRRRRVGATAVTLPTVARLASVADTSHHGGVENARPASAPTDTAYADEITVEMKGTLATKAVEHAERAEEEDLRQKHTLRGVIMRRYVTRHATWLFLAFCTIAATEQHLLETPSPKPNTRSPTTLFAFLFEILSAYGTNGLSYGYPGVNYNLVRSPRVLCPLETLFVAVVFLLLLRRVSLAPIGALGFLCFVIVDNLIPQAPHGINHI